MTDLEIVAQVAAAHGIDSLPATHLEFYKALIAAGRANAAPSAPVSPRRERLDNDLALIPQYHPEVKLDKSVMIRGTPHTIVGYNRNAPKHAFIIEGPQGGRYKCPLSMIIAGQR